MRLTARIARVRIADYEFQTGDGYLLPDIEITIGESDRASSAKFTISDPGLLIGAEFMKMSIATGGIVTPPDLLKDPNKSQGGATSTTTTPGNFGGGNAAATEQAIVAECLRQGVTDDGQIAYILATAKHESGNYVYYEEIASGSAYEGRDDLGNTQSGDGVRFKGRGLAQVTGRTNYKKYSDLLGRDFTKDPKGMAEPSVALFTLVHGSRTGIFTGVGVGDYINGSKRDFMGARAVINGSDQASLIAGYAQEYLARVPQLKNSSGSKIQPAMTPAQSPTAPPIAQATPPVESSIKGTEIIIELGYTPSALIAFHFIHTGTRCAKDGAETTTLEGKSLRWLLTRVPQTRSFEAVNLKQVAQILSESLGAKIEFEGKGQTYQHLDMTSLTPFQLLSREAKSIGYRIADKGNKLILEPEARPEFTDFVIDEDVLISADFGDQARADGPSPGTATSQSDGAGGAAKSVLNLQSGQTTTLTPNTTAGTGKPTGDTAVVAGASAAAVGGTVKQPGGAPATAEPAKPAGPEKRTVTREEGNTKITEEITIERKEEPTQVTTTTTTVATSITITNSSGNKTVKTTVETKVGTAKGTTITTKVTDGNNAPVTTTTNTADIDSKFTRGLDQKQNAQVDQFGLPKQPPGIIDLADGRAEGLQIADESKRIKGYESSAVLMSTEEVLQLVPGQIIALSSRLFPEPFDREWRIAEVRHQWKEGTTTINFYTPQLPPPSSGGGSAAAPTAATSVPTGKILNPHSDGGQRGTPFDPSGTIRGRPHQGVDTLGDYGIRAGFSGTVADAENSCRVGDTGCGGGLGNLVFIAGEGEWAGYTLRYAHLASAAVTKGQKVQVGQVVGQMGDTGHSFGDHLHMELLKGDQRIDPEPYISPCFTGVYGQGSGTPLKCKG